MGMSVRTKQFSGDAEMTVDTLTTFSGSMFQMEEAAAGKARLPTVESWTSSLLGTEEEYGSNIHCSSST